MKLAKPHFDLAHSPGHLLRRCQQYAGDLYAREMGLNGLTARQFEVLWTVEANEGASQTELVRLTGIDRSTLADLIARMIRKDLLARRRVEGDQRANSVRITARGARALRMAAHSVARAESLVLDPLPPFRRAEFLRSLAMIAETALAESLAAFDSPRRGRQSARRR